MGANLRRALVGSSFSQKCEEALGRFLLAQPDLYSSSLSQRYARAQGKGCLKTRNLDRRERCCLGSY